MPTIPFSTFLGKYRHFTSFNIYIISSLYIHIIYAFFIVCIYQYFRIKYMEGKCYTINFWHIAIDIFFILIIVIIRNRSVKVLYIFEITEKWIILLSYEFLFLQLTYKKYRLKSEVWQLMHTICFWNFQCNS